GPHRAGRNLPRCEVRARLLNRDAFEPLLARLSVADRRLFDGGDNQKLLRVNAGGQQTRGEVLVDHALDAHDMIVLPGNGNPASAARDDDNTRITPAPPQANTTIPKPNSARIGSLSRPCNGRGDGTTLRYWRRSTRRRSQCGFSTRICSASSAG